jgi:hypothetical protein
MSTETAESAPEHLLDGGRALWSSVLGKFELDPHEVAVLLRAAETIDSLDELQAEIDRTGRVVDGRPSPCLVEHRQQSVLLSRLLAGLRLPEEDGETVKQAQRRGGARSPYKVGGR